MQRPRDKGGTKGVFVKENFHNRVACWRSVFPWLWASLNKFARPRQPLVRPWTTPKDPSLYFPLVSLLPHLLSLPYFFFFLYIYFFYSPTISFFSSTIVFARLFCVRKYSPRNAMEFGAGCGSSTHASLQKLKEATLSLPASRAIVPFDTKEEGVRTQETLVITSIRSRRRRIVYFNLVPLTRGIKESRTTFTLLLYTPRGETSRSLPL